MSIPLDDLYHYIDVLFEKHALIYRFFPHGSKNIGQLWPMRPLALADTVVKPVVICHDQEPLNFDLYSQDNIKNFLDDKNLEYLNLGSACWANFHQQMILLHSEFNSPEVEKYQATGRFAPCYYWSHALIARDWYRFAQHDLQLSADKIPGKTFNIYNRSWTGTREYRLKFTEMIVKAGLANDCQMKFSSTDNGQHFHLFRPVNPALAIQQFDLNLYFPDNKTSASASAEYSADDYCNTLFDVVLETLADDKRIHLTEKILRPIACGQPFLLVGTANSLAYLKRYGFKTYSDFIDESYDEEPDIVKRMSMVIDTMANIRSRNNDEFRAGIQAIADWNRQYFFSDEFFQQVTQELIDNVTTASETAFTVGPRPSTGTRTFVSVDDPVKTTDLSKLYDQFKQL